MNRQFTAGFFTGIVLLVISLSIQEATTEQPLHGDQSKLVSDLQGELRLQQSPRAREVDALAAMLTADAETYKQDLATNLMASSTNPVWRAKLLELFARDMPQLKRQIAGSLLVTASLDEWTKYLKGGPTDRLATRKCMIAFEAVTAMSRKMYAAEKAAEAQAALGLTDEQIMRPEP